MPIERSIERVVDGDGRWLLDDVMPELRRGSSLPTDLSHHGDIPFMFETDVDKLKQHMQRMDNENRELRLKCTQLQAVMRAAERQSTEDMISMVQEFRQAKDELDQLAADNLNKEEELQETRRALRNTRESMAVDSMPIETDEEEMMRHCEARIDEMREQFEAQRQQLEEECQARVAEAKAELSRVTRKNSTMLLQIRFMEAQVGMLQKEKASLELKMANGRTSATPDPQRVSNSESCVDIGQLQQENRDLRDELLREKAVHATTKSLCQKYKQAQASLLGMVDCYAGSVEQVLQHRQETKKHGQSALSAFNSSIIASLGFQFAPHFIFILTSVNMCDF